MKNKLLITILFLSIGQTNLVRATKISTSSSSSGSGQITMSQLEQLDPIKNNKQAFERLSMEEKEQLLTLYNSCLANIPVIDRGEFFLAEEKSKEFWFCVFALTRNFACSSWYLSALIKLGRVTARLFPGDEKASASSSTLIPLPATPTAHKRSAPAIGSRTLGRLSAAHSVRPAGQTETNLQEFIASMTDEDRRDLDTCIPSGGAGWDFGDETEVVFSPAD